MTTALQYVALWLAAMSAIALLDWTLCPPPLGGWR